MQTYQESHLYPCQLSLLHPSQFHGKKFFFHSPINAYSIIYDPKTHNSDYLDHDQTRYLRLSNFSLKPNQRYTLMSNSQKIAIIGNYPRPLHEINLKPSQEIISDLVLVPQNVSSRASFSLAHMVKDKSKQQDSVFISVKNYEISKKSQKQYSQNPESQKFIKPEEEECSTQQYDDSLVETFKKISNFTLDLPLLQNLTKFSIDSFQLNFNQFDRYNNALAIFQKQTSTLNIYDQEYQTFIYTISCSHDSDNRLMTEYQSNKTSFLTENLIVNSHSKGIVKLLDLRMARVAHIRNLSQEITTLGQRPLNKRQQNVIKFWNEQKTETLDHALSQSSQFLINLKNHICQVDLRNSRLVKENSVFKFESSEQMTSFEISSENEQRYFAYTTEAQMIHKAYVVQMPLNP